MTTNKHLPSTGATMTQANTTIPPLFFAGPTSTSNSQTISLTSLTSILSDLIQVDENLRGAPLSELQLVSRAALLADRRRAYELGLEFTKGQRKLVGELQRVQEELDGRVDEIEELKRKAEWLRGELSGKTVEVGDLKGKLEGKTAEMERLKAEQGVGELGEIVGGAISGVPEEIIEVMRNERAVLKGVILDLNRQLEMHRVHQSRPKQDEVTPNSPVHLGSGGNKASNGREDNPNSNKRRRISDLPEVPPTNTTYGGFSAAANGILLKSQTTPRTLYIKFTTIRPGVDELISNVIGGRVESVYWNTPFPGRRFAFVNFVTRADARQYLDYIEKNPTHLPPGLQIEWGQKLKSMTPAVAEAIIEQGATRIVRVSRIPSEINHGDIWCMAGKTTFRFVRVVQRDDGCTDIALEFNSIEDAMGARGALEKRGQLEGCGFSWGSNVTDHLVEGFARIVCGDGKVVRMNR